MVVVSVIIPNYNHAPFLEKRIASVLNQSYENFEIIILDDGSTDHSREVLEAYRAHPKVTHIEYNETNSGSTFHQWQKGLLLAAGKYIWIAESDDYCEPTFLAELIPRMDEDPALVVAYCQSLYVSTAGMITHRTVTEKLAAKFSGEEYLKTSLLGTNTIVNASMAVFRKDKALTIPQDFRQMRYCGDWLFWVYLCFQGSVFVSGKYLNYYLRHGNNVASNATRQGLDFLEGNKIYHLIAEKIQIDPVSKNNALKERAIEYMRTRLHFVNESIGREVWQSLLQLDPAITSIIRTMRWREKRLHYATKLKMLLTGKHRV